MKRKKLHSIYQLHQFTKMHLPNNMNLVKVIWYYKVLQVCMYARADADSKAKCSRIK